MNAIVFGRDKGEKSEDFCLLGRYICQGILFTCSHITVVIVYYFYFLFVGFTWLNSIVFGGEKGTRSEGRGLFWYYLRDAVTDNKMIPQALSLHMIDLSLYCRNISFLSMRVIRCMMHISHQEYRDILELDCIHSFWSQNTENKKNRR